MWNPIKFVMSKPGASLVLGGSLLFVLIMLEAPVLDPALAVCESYACSYAINSDLVRNPSTNAAGLVPGTLHEAIPPQVIFCAARKPSSYVQLSHYAVHAVRARILSLLGRDLWQIVQLNATRWVVAAKLHPVVSHWINPCDRSEAMMGLAGSA
jgi:hypothetical protein